MGKGTKIRTPILSALAHRSKAPGPSPGAFVSCSHDLRSRLLGEPHAVGDADAVVRVADDVKTGHGLEPRLNVRDAIEMADERLRARGDVAKDAGEAGVALDADER